MAKPMWMVRAGRNGYFFDEIHQCNCVAIGWDKLGDLQDIRSADQMRELYNKHYPEEKPGKINSTVAMLLKFRKSIKEGQYVITYNPQQREYLIGIVKSDYRYDFHREHHKNIRDVEWLGIVNRDDLKATTRDALGPPPTLFLVKDEAVEDVLATLHGKKRTDGEKDDQDEEREELEQIKEDTIGRALELIKDRILKLDSEDMEQLVAAVLRAMGYKARVTPKGPDRGVDVIASPDGLGLEEPRIKAEVKHRQKTAMGSQEIRSFLGGLRQGDRALYVSTGGFSKDANYEADRSNIPITLIGLDDLASLVVTHYESFDMDGKVLVPLSRLYWPVE